MVKTDSVLLSAAQYAVKLCVLPSAAVTAVCSCPGRFGVFFCSSRWDNVGYLVSGQSWLLGWGRREHARYVLEAFLLCCSMCWGEVCLKNGSTQNIGLICQVSSGLETRGLAE